MRQSFVLPEHVANFSRTNTDVSGGYVSIRADVVPQFSHEGLAKTHHFGIRFSLGVKIRAAFTSAHRQGGKAVLEGLFKSEEFENAQIDRGVKSQAPLVGTN